ncbi:cadherin repeat domain-containing protein, partial [Porticoccaceae bacterium]|nr:cadherin repeat domain-containing protein [Porticoccaceae bacterium]
YNFTVIATDIANNISQQTVTVSINDLDDAAPTVTSGAVADVIDENSGAGQVIYTVTADDSGDDVAATPITYSLTEDSDTGLSIDALTGAVSLTADPDHESQSEYSFAVVATDAAGNASEAQSVTLNINDLDDAAPTITSGAVASIIDENTGAGQVIYTATADDSADISAGFSFSLTQESDAGLTIDASTGTVTLAVDPDHETQSQYSFAVIATDTAGNSSAAQSVILNINDLDDAAPTITSADTADAIDENSGAGQVIYSANSNDSADDVVKGPISYSLAEGSDAGLSIDSQSGLVTLIANPDHESQIEYNFSVIATDGAGNASEPKSVSLNINDLDDAAPTITSGATATAIDENSGAEQVIYTATADDSADVSEGVTFSLADDSDSALSIDATSGEVTLASDSDHEAQGQYSFSVIATDAAGNQSASQAVTLDINDLDDADPVLTSSDTATAIDENSGAGQVVYTATSNDSADNVSDTPITYSLSEDSDTALSIDSATGDVTLTNNPDHEAQSQYSFAVIATDAAGNASDAQSVTLDINDLDDAAPTITSGAVADAIDENSGAGQVVYTATADDSADDVADTPIIYSLTSDSDTGLSIDSVTGVVTLNSNPDYESQSQYSFAVIATDNAGNASEAQAVNLEINNLDDAAPTITSGATAVAIDENSGAEQVIYTATADDSADISEGITFSLADGSDAELSIDSTTGAVTLASVPNYETQSQYSFAVVATDAAGNTSAAQSVTLDINNLDEVAPTITSGDSAAVLESSGADTLVYRALADDSADVSAGVTFSLSEDSDTALSINAETGEVTLTDEPDFVAKPSYSFTVIADDGVNQSQKAVTLSVVDEDLEAP